MGLKNIYSRKDFTKVYEIFGGTQGGVGDHDGFANNAKLKDTYLGMLMNGVFKGISWLWKKSKENFIINKMIGRLINELMRGIIVYCLENDIDLKTGKTSEIIDDETEKEDGEESKTPEYKEKDPKTWSIDDYREAVKERTVEELQEQLTELKNQLTDLEKQVSDYQKLIDNDQYKLDNVKLTKDEIKKKQDAIKNTSDQVKIFNEKIEFIKQIIEVFIYEIKSRKSFADGENVEKVSKNVKPDLTKIHNVCVKKYNFDPTSDEIPEVLKNMNIITPQQFKKNYKPITADKILIGDEFNVRTKNGFRIVKVDDVNVEKNLVTVSSGTGDKGKTFSNKIINVSNLRPKNFPNYSKTNKILIDYFQKYASMYDRLSEFDKQGLEKNYMAYAYLNKLAKDYDTIFGININESLDLEDLDYEYDTEVSYDDYDFEYDHDSLIESMIYEFNVKDTYNKSKEIGDKEITNMRNPIRKSSEIVGTSGDVKIKPGEPKAGKISAGKAITQMGVSPTVGDLLTKRDKEKYKNKAEDFDTKVYDINLAEIEKTVESQSSKSGVDIREKVAEYVNPYNLKVIQITINQLFSNQIANEAIATTSYSDDSKLKLKWDKKVDNVFASFYKIMDTELIKSIMNSAKSITSGKVVKKAEEEANKIKGFEKVMQIAEKLPLDEKEDINLNTLKNKTGYYCWYNFTYKKESYNTVISPIVDLINKNVPIFQISPFFELKDNAIKPVDIKKMGIFKSTDTDIKITDSNPKINVYFLLKQGQIFPYNGNRTFKILILNEIITSTGTQQLFLMANKDNFKLGDTVNFLINDELLKNFDTTKFTHSVDSYIFKRFDKNIFDTQKTNYRVGNVYSSGKLPTSMTDDVVNIISQLSEKIK